MQTGDAIRVVVAAPVVVVVAAVAVAVVVVVVVVVCHRSCWGKKKTEFTTCFFHWGHKHNVNIIVFDPQQANTWYLRLFFFLRGMQQQ